MDGKVVTLVIHGTFAAESTWWQLGRGAFADRLEQALSTRGLKGTVWKPALEAGFAYEHFAWTGKNLHRDRIDGAQKIARNINTLAERLGATAEAPLMVHFVGHSHGGNVVLEVLNRLGPRVKPAGVVLLGTPLLRFVPAFRPARLLFASTLLALVTLVIVGMFLCVIGSPAPFLWPILRPYAIYVPLALGLILLFALLLANLFGIARGILDLLWWLICLPFLIRRKRWRSQVYGPPPAQLLKLLNGRQVLSLGSAVDEAGLALLLCSAPRRYLHEKIRSDLLAYLDFVLFDFVVDIPEILLERHVLGFGWMRVLFSDFVVSEEDDKWAYPVSAIVREDVTSYLGIPKLPASTAIRNAEAQRILDEYDEIARDLAEVANELHRDASISDLLARARKHIVDQVKLRHSLYYENDRIIDRIAVALTA